MELQIIQARYDRMTEIAKDLRETQTKLVDVVPRLPAAREVLDRTKLRSPYRLAGSFAAELAIDRAAPWYPTMNERRCAFRACAPRGGTVELSDGLPRHDLRHLVERHPEQVLDLLCRRPPAASRAGDRRRTACAGR
jgi:hypothetical protein